MYTAYPQIEEKRYFAQRFALWLAIGAMIMMFAGFTSAYIVKKGDAENWTKFIIPLHFYFSTGILLLSSVFMHLAVRSFKKNELRKYKQMILTTLLLGCGFIILQYIGWRQLAFDGITLTEEISGSFFYIISGTHGMHVIGGLLILWISFRGISRKLKDPVYDLTMDVSPQRKLRVELVATYWHFMDALWLYIFIFLLYNHL